MSEDEKPGPINYFFAGHSFVGDSFVGPDGATRVVLLSELARQAREGEGTFKAVLDALMASSDAGGDLLEEEVDTETARQRALRLAKDAADASPPISDQHREAKAAAQRTAEVMLVWRIRGEHGLPQDKVQPIVALATSDLEAFDQLLRLSGLDAMEIETEGLSYDRLQGSVNLLDELERLTGDEYGMATQEMALPLLQSVVHQLMDDAESADGI